MAETEFERGQAAGAITAKLAEHDQHFKKINGSIDETAAELRRLAKLIVDQGHEASAREREVVATAAALAVSEQARRDRSIQAWSPWQKIATLVVALVALATFGLAVFHYSR